MPVLKRKSKVITFRASPDEYEALAISCSEAGARSISAFARSAVLERVHLMGGRQVSISGDLASLGNALSELDLSLREASNKIRRLLGNAEAKSAEHH